MSINVSQAAIQGYTECSLDRSRLYKKYRLCRIRSTGFLYMRGPLYIGLWEVDVIYLVGACRIRSTGFIYRGPKMYGYHNYSTTGGAHHSHFPQLCMHMYCMPV